jgi:hypothetical protein
MIGRRKLPVCATVAETTFSFHYVLIRGFRLKSAPRSSRRRASLLFNRHINKYIDKGRVPPYIPRCLSLRIRSKFFIEIRSILKSMREC